MSYLDYTNIYTDIIVLVKCWAKEEYFPKLLKLSTIMHNVCVMHVFNSKAEHDIYNHRSKLLTLVFTKSNFGSHENL